MTYLAYKSTNNTTMTSMQIQPIFAEATEVTQVRQQADQITQALLDNAEGIILSLRETSEKTKKNYLSDIKYFLDFIRANGINVHSYADFKEYLKTIDRAISSKNRYLSSTRKLLKEAVKYRILPVDITANTKTFKRSTAHKVEGLSKAQIKQVADHIKQIRSEKKRTRLSAMYNLFVLEGLRQIEVARLTITDLHLDDNYILVHGKQRDDKDKFYISCTTAKALHNWIKLSGIKSGYVFPGRSAQQITTKALQLIFTDSKTGIFPKLGIEAKTLHGFRHFNITYLLEVTNGDVTKVQQRSRHKNVQTVMIYNDARLSKQQVEDLSVHFNSLSL
jgi:integrase/recombinase XerC